MQIDGLYSSLPLTDISETENEGTEETVLASIIIPPNTFRVLGDAIRVNAAWAYAANDNVKTIKMYFGSSTDTINGRTFADNNFFATLTGEIYNKNGFQRSISRLTAQDGFSINMIRQYNEDIGQPIRIRITGQGSASGDVTSRILKVEYVPINNLMFG